MTTAEWIGMLFAVGSVVGTVVAFSVAHAVKLAGVYQNQEAMLAILDRLSSESQKRIESAGRLTDAIKRLEESIDRMNGQVMADHKEMLKILSTTKEGLVSGLAEISKVQASTLEVIKAHDQWQRDMYRDRGGS